MAELVRDVRTELGATFVVVEHDISFISDLATRLIVLDQGMVLAMGPAGDVLRRQDVEDAFLGTSAVARARSGSLAAESSGADGAAAGGHRGERAG